MADLPEHLKDDASYLQCNKCGRKSWSEVVNSVCGMRQPNGERCAGRLRGKEPERGGDPQ